MNLGEHKCWGLRCVATVNIDVTVRGLIQVKIFCVDSINCVLNWNL